jgi:glycosyltransferase involved in cell wall biosynthesis
MIPISVIMLTKNEAVNIQHSLPPIIQNFDDVHVVDSDSTDDTANIAQDMGAKVTPFTWNNQYPKKKQWALDIITLKNDWILMIDADETITGDFVSELQSMDFDADGYFISSTMVWNDTPLKYGAKNNKLCLFKKSVFEYPPVDDLDLKGGWEVEGHYQPVIRENQTATIDQIKSPITHHDRKGDWQARHGNYIQWERGMNARNAWPVDPVFKREFMKDMFRTSALRPYVHFAYGYIIKGGFLDGKNGFDFALKRFSYNRSVVKS